MIKITPEARALIEIEITPEAQALIDRLAAMDQANPRHDKAAIERALTAHLDALGLPERPLVWADDARTGHRIVSERAVVDASRYARDERYDAAYDAAETDSYCDTDFWFILNAAVARNSGDAWQAVWAVAGRVWTGQYRPELEVIDAIIEVADDGGLTRGKLARIFLPMLDAVESGLWLYWITPLDIICVLRPSLSIEGGHLHCSDGPAVVWSSGEAYHFWHGVHVPAWIIEEKHRITVESIREEPNQEIRRCMTEIYGRSRYLRDAGARLVHQDEYGRLWETQIGEETWRIVEVENGTPEPDGTRRIYTLEVTGAAEELGWPIETARAAVAATYGLRPEEYSPEVRT